MAEQELEKELRKFLTLSMTERNKVLVHFSSIRMIPETTNLPTRLLNYLKYSSVGIGLIRLLRDEEYISGNEWRIADENDYENHPTKGDYYFWKNKKEHFDALEFLEKEYPNFLKIAINGIKEE